jgi:PTH1 family peptidyl-tRNA hydrolase
MRLLVGLGNPGPRYAGNRHNIGFMAVDAIVRRHSFSAIRERFHGLTAEGTIDGEKVLALVPQTFMNDSGRAVQAAMQFFKLQPEEIIVIYDEIDLPLGKVKAKRGGGAGGHNGIRSIDAHIGADYWRIRMGVDHPGQKELVKSYVLMDFFKEEHPQVQAMLDAVTDAIPLMIAGDDGRFMNKVSVALNPPPPKKKNGSDPESES